MPFDPMAPSQRVNRDELRRLLTLAVLALASPDDAPVLRAVEALQTAIRRK